MRKYEILLKTDIDNVFTPYEEGQELKSAYEGYTTLKEGTAVLLKRLYVVFNVDHPENYDDRSVAIGDVIKIDGVRFAVEAHGFRELDGD